MKTLHFTLGPVQSFVEQARRTRDWWAGSFLLSYLSGQAMKAVLDTDGGKIVFPQVGTQENPTDPLLAAILGKPFRDVPEPEIGSLPNRFKAQVPDGFEPESCKQAIKDKWNKIANAVWQEYVAPMADHGNGTKAIWNEQVKHFWDMAWVCDDDPGDKSDSAWLDQRKNWRTHHPPQEGGDHCTLMGEWSELSGYVRAQESNKQDAFWTALREQVGTFDLGPNERLCAIALIKRLYPKIAQETIGWELDVKHWPSTPYMAAVPWLKSAHRGNAQDCSHYAEFVERHLGEKAFRERGTKLPSVSNLGPVAQLDGDFFFENALKNEKATPLKQLEDGSDDDQFRQQIVSELQSLQNEVGQPSPFYALLLLDGDHLGKLLRDNEETELSQALSEFTDKVDETVKGCCGKTIYAGGDDVLTLLPLDEALKAACKLRQRYREAFQTKPEATISAAIVFAHYNLSLRAVLKEAHRQLDDVAKTQNGRDSLAIAVLSGSGRTVEWASTWEDSSNQRLIPELFETLRQRFADKQFSSKFIYNVRQRLEPLLDDDDRLIEGLDPKELLLAEYQKNREKRLEKAEVEALVEQLLQVCQRRPRERNDADSRSLMIDGALLVRFLAHQGVSK